MLVKVSAGINVCLLDGLEEGLGNTTAFNVDQVGLEECFRGTKALTTDLNDTAIGKLW